MGASVSWTGEGEAKKGHERIGMIIFFMNVFVTNTDN